MTILEYPNIHLSVTLGILHVNGGAVTWNNPKGRYVEPQELLEGHNYVLDVETGVLTETDAFGTPAAPPVAKRATKWGTPARYWWFAVLQALVDLGGACVHRSRIFDKVVENNRRELPEISVRGSAKVALGNAALQGYILQEKPYYSITKEGVDYLQHNLKTYEDFNK